MNAGVVALATLLYASGRPLPRRPRRYLVLWGRVGWILRKYGVAAEEHAYWTAVRGRRYRRYKVVVRDEAVTATLARLDEAKLRRLMLRFESVTRDVLRGMRRISGWHGLVRLLPRARLLRWFGVKPFNYMVYAEWRNRTIVRRLKPNWRAWLYVMRLAPWRGSDLA